MSDQEEAITETIEGNVTKEDEQQDEKPATADESQPEEKEDNGLMGEIMQLVRNGSPSEDKPASPQNKEATGDKGAATESAEVKGEEGGSTEDKEEEKQQQDEEKETAPPSDEQATTQEEEKKEEVETVTKSKEEEEVVKGKEEEEEEKVKATTDDAAGEKESPAPKEEGEEKKILTPHLLSDEEIIAKGVAESDIEMFRKFYIKQMYSPKAWYDLIKDHTFTSEFIALSPDEINALLALHHSPNEETAPEVSDEVKSVIEQLKEKIDGVISQYGEEGAFIKLNNHSVRDAVLDRSDPDHIQAVEDGIQNELEIEQQFVNAYLNWRSWRSMSYRENSRTRLPSERQRDNVVRRSFRRIQRSFNRPRSGSAVPAETAAAADGKDEGKNATPLAEETPKDQEEGEGKKEDGEKKEEDDGKTEETKDENEKTAEENNKGEAEGEEKEGGAEKTPDKEQTTPPPATPSQDVLTVEATLETEDQSKEKEEESGKEETKADDSEPAAATVTTETTEEKKEAAEIEELKPKESKDSTPAATGEERKQSRVPPPMLGKEHQFIKVKSETRSNKILRAFIKATTAMYKVTSGEEAIKLLTTSRVIKEDLEQAKVFANISGAEAVLCIQRWHADVSKYPGMQFRAFVYKSKLNALSQKDDVAYIPNIVRYKDTIQTKIVHFFNSTVKKSFHELDNYVVDVFVGSNKIYVVDLYPFHTTTGACLFTWQQNQKVLLNGPLQFRHIPTPFKNCYTGLHPHWQQVCSGTEQKKKQEARGNQKCVIL